MITLCINSTGTGRLVQTGPLAGAFWRQSKVRVAILSKKIVCHIIPSFGQVTRVQRVCENASPITLSRGVLSVTSRESELFITPPL